MLPAITLDPGTLNAQVVASLLETHGLVCLEDVKEELLVAVMEALGTAFEHPDADHDRVTRLHFDREKSRGVNKQGFSSSRLRLHTDRSVLPNPPDLLAFWCEQQAGVGGQTTLADGKIVYRILEKRYPFLIKHLENPDNFVFKSADGMIPGAIFEVGEGNRRSVRLRLDDLLYVSRPLWGWMDVLIKSIEEASIQYRLQPGNGYILQNRRWLHGREAFRGSRTCKRLLSFASEEYLDLKSFKI